MGKAINLLRNYPKSKRNLKKRAQIKSQKIRSIARKFGKNFFDGDRKYGYGGFNYNPKYWKSVILDLKKYWKLNSKSSVLDVGCAKGFFLYDLKKKIPNIRIAGLDISKYAIKNGKKEVKKFLKVGSADKLPFKDNSFDYVISINTIHNLPQKKCEKALLEINRVTKKKSFVTVDAYKNNRERKRMYDWNLTAKTILSVKNWKKLFQKNKFKGDYYWFIP